MRQGGEVCKRLSEKRGLSEHASSLLFGLIQDELFDSFKSMSLDDAADQIGLSKQSARTYVGELLDAGLAVQSGKRPLRIQASEAVKHPLMGTGLAARMALIYF